MLNPNPVTPAVIKGVSASATTAQADKTGGTGANIVTLYTATAAAAPPGGGNGALVQDVTFTSPATTAAGCVVIFKNVSGTRYILKEVLVTVVTSSPTAIGWTSGKIVLNEFLAPGDKIDFLTTITQTIAGVGNVGEY